MDRESTHYGERLLQEIRGHGKSIAEVAKAAKLNAGYLGRVMQRRHVSTEYIEKVCQVLDIDPAVILQNEATDRISITGVSNSKVKGASRVGIICDNSANEIELYKKLLSEKELLLKEKERLIEVLLEERKSLTKD